MITRAIDRTSFIGGSDARLIMGVDESALVRLWREKRSEIRPEDLSKNLIVQLGVATEELNRRWYEANSGNEVHDVQRHLRHPIIGWMGATLDGFIRKTSAVFESKFMLPWTFSEEAAVQKHMAQLQHNMCVANTGSAVLSIITGAGKWIEVQVTADPMYQHLLLVAEKKFWRCVQTGDPPRVFGLNPPRPRIEAVRVADMSSSNAWAKFADIYQRTAAAFQDHETARAELKKLMPEDAREAVGHGLRAKRSRSGAVSFDVIERGTTNAPLQ